LTYWFDDQRKTAFCLIEAPDKNALRKMHRFAHGEVPNQIIEVDPKIVESFLGRIEDPAKAKNTSLNIINDPAFRIMMAIELRKSFQLKNDAASLDTVLQKFRDGISNKVSVYEGSVVRQTKDHFLISFKNVSKAIGAACDIRAEFHQSKNKLLHKLVNLKIGLSAGVPVTEKKSFFEETIKLADRMCRALKGEMIVSSEVKELYDSENATPLHEQENCFFLSEADKNFLSLLMDHAELVWSDAGLKIDDLNKPLGCSKSQLYRKMIALTGKSPLDFLKEYRLNEALKLLTKKSGNVSEVAYKTGFTSPSYFSKCFQKQFGCLPSDYFHFQLNSAI
jgi:AraC-like DNA-binding protein